MKDQRKCHICSVQAYSGRSEAREGATPGNLVPSMGGASRGSAAAVGGDSTPSMPQHFKYLSH